MVFGVLYRWPVFSYPIKSDSRSVCKNMRLRMTESRELRMEYLLEATGEKTKSKVLDRTAEFYL